MKIVYFISSHAESSALWSLNPEKRGTQDIVDAPKVRDQIEFTSFDYNCVKSVQSILHENYDRFQIKAQKKRQNKDRWLLITATL